MDRGERVSLPEGDADTKGVWSLVILFNSQTGQFDVQADGVPICLALGLIEYASVLLRRKDAENAMRAAMQNRPLVALPGARH